MRKTLLTAILISTTAMAQENPFFQDFDTPYGSIPFSKIKNEHYMPAIDRGIELARKEIDAIASNPEAPSFDNTLVALDRAGSDLNRVLNVFFNILEADSNEELMEMSMVASQKLSDYSTDIILNQPLWLRVKAVYDQRDSLSLTPEQQTLLKTTYDSFANSGANLQGDDREKYKQLSAELSQLTTLFGQNVLKETNTKEMWLTSDDLSGLPESFVTSLAEAAKEKGRDGEYLVTLAAPCYMGFMQYSDRADLREQLYKMQATCNTSGEYNNLDIIKRIASLRRQIANLLGFETYADQKLQNTMAQTPAAVYDLLNKLRDAYAPTQKKDMEELEAFAGQKINPWDYSYYSNKLKQERYSFDQEALRPYFPLNQVIDGVFGLATKLYGVKFTEIDNVDIYHPDVKVYKVSDSNGDYLGLLYTDFFPRASKRQGAWMTAFKEQWREPDGTNSRPLVSIVMNFTKPTADAPSLLTPYEVETFLHEFGHSLHGLLTQCTYQSISGTSVYRDFVELPSQFNENYLTQKEFLDTFARHYQTGEAIPQELIDRLVASQQYGAAYSCLRQLMFGYIDMAWHTITEDVDEPLAFERQAYESVAMFPDVPGAMTSTRFNHIFSGGYAAGYYSYKWAEVLDADAFAKFEENGIFDPSTAQAFRENILERGGTENPAVLYRRFRGADPTIDALLRRDGILPPLPKNDIPVPSKD